MSNRRITRTDRDGLEALGFTIGPVDQSVRCFGRARSRPVGPVGGLDPVHRLRKLVEAAS